MGLAMHAHQVNNTEDAEYTAFMRRIGARFSELTRSGADPVFITDAEDLWGAYLGGFATAAERQYHNCSACRSFIQRFGSLVVIGEDGNTTPAIWDAEIAPPAYRASLAALAQQVRRAKVTGPYLAKESVWGTPSAGGWAHFSVPGIAYKHAVLTAGHAMAEKREDFKNIMFALSVYTPQVLDTALQILETDSVYRAEAVIGPAQFLRKLHNARAAAAAGPRVSNVTWKAIATAPAGFLHPRSSMVGTLLEDIAEGKSFDDVKRAFEAKMHPLRYQRPQAAPSAGNIAQAEKLVAQLGLAPALERRIARLEEIPKLWEPKQQPAAPAAGGVFGHLTPKGATASPSIQIPAVTMTLEKFVRTVIPEAQEMAVHLEHSTRSFIAITAPVNADAPKLFQWDHPFAWYVWNGGAPADQYGLTVGAWQKVAAITRLPARWGDEAEKFTHHGDAIILLLDSARETREAGAALFPSLLRSELHQVRSTLEAHSRSGRMHGLSDGTAIGLDLRRASGGPGYPVTVRVTAGGRTQDYRIDRWD